ncbi:MAG: hypothetical protein EHM53_02145 [Methanoregulaceae archaeon]|nr:MAG: hypothetical protein EHM53_02145 [Methanoregulaceae archaeon]
MDLLTPILTSFGLSMDSFAVSLVIGSTTESRLSLAALITALFFWRVPGRNDGSRPGGRDLCRRFISATITG